MFKRLLVVFVAMMFVCGPAFAGDRPEFDAVANDAANYFNDLVKNLVVQANPWNANSDFPWNPVTRYGELFVPPVQLTPDWCFPNYLSAYTQWRRPALYTWYIVLQMDPQSDIDINIRDCVVKHNSKTAFGTAPWEGADQTGRFQLTDGTPVFVPGANPRMTVTAFPGPFAVFGFVSPFILTNRAQGGLAEQPFDDLLFTSKALWEEGLVGRMPEFLRPAPEGVEYPLSAGDMLRIDVEIPFINSVDLRYGQDNVTVKYVGIDGTIATP